MTQPIRVPAQYGAQLLLTSTTRHLSEMDRDLQALLQTSALESGREERHVAFRRVAAQIDADDAAVAEPPREGDDLARLLGRVAPVNGEDEARSDPSPAFHHRRRLLLLLHRPQHRVYVPGLVESGSWHGARRRPQFEVDDAVGGEVAHGGARRVGEGLGVVD